MNAPSLAAAALVAPLAVGSDSHPSYSNNPAGNSRPPAAPQTSDLRPTAPSSRIARRAGDDAVQTAPLPVGEAKTHSNPQES